MAPSDGYLCWGLCKVEAERLLSRYGTGPQFRWGGEAYGSSTQREVFQPSLSLCPHVALLTHAFQRARSQASSALPRGTSSSWTMTQESRS